MLTFDSPVARWPGTVSTSDYLTYPQLIEWEKALDEAKRLGEDKSVAEFYAAFQPIIWKIVKKWDIAGLDDPPALDDFPGSPPLMSWLVEVISDLYKKTNDIDPK